VSATYESLIALDDEIARCTGQFTLSPFWRAFGERGYRHPTAGMWIGQVGRGGAKSFFSRRVGLNECVNGDWDIPSGERHYFLFGSENRDEALQRIAGLETDLRALGIRFERDGDEIRLVDLPRGFIVRAARIGAFSGFRAFGYALDELAKIKADPTLANPAPELISSANAMLVTHQRSTTDRPKRLLLSSPFSVVDAHYEAFARGDTPDQLVVNAPSWIANPGITEEETRRLEPEESTWLREYKAIPSAAAGLAFGEPSLVEACFGPMPEGYAA
jgi:hypothetical protein